jgi:hypothetical protein
MERELAVAEPRPAEEPSARNLERLTTVRNRIAAACGASASGLDRDAAQSRCAARSGDEENGLRRDREGS